MSQKNKTFIGISIEPKYGKAKADFSFGAMEALDLGKSALSIKNIDGIETIKIGDNEIKLISDFRVPKDEIWVKNKEGEKQIIKIINMPE